MKVVTIKHGDIFSTTLDMFYDFVHIDGEPIETSLFLLEDLTTPEKFVKAVTADNKAFTYLSTLQKHCDLEQLQDEYEATKEDFVVVVTKLGKPWVSVLFSQLNW